MASSPLLQLTEIGLTFGGTPLLEGISGVIHPGDRLALVGRNGSGKSTLMKVMAGLVEPDDGAVSVPQGIHVGYMDQDPEFSGFATLGDFATEGLPDNDLYRIERAAAGLGFDPARDTATASGGERRRAVLARLMAEAPELMLLDEPTNHLDIASIAWLEGALAASPSAALVISHDRMFLRRVTKGTLWLDRGVLRRSDKGFDQFETWRDTVWAEEDLARHKLNRKIKAEARWAVEGISGRRKRNQGRLRALADLRKERAEMIRRKGSAGLVLEQGERSGKRVIEAVGLSKRFGDQVICDGFDLTIARGDKVAVVGPNGAGKTTLLKMLLGEVEPDKGHVRHGTQLEIAVFDQTRAALDPDMSLWDAMTTGDGRVSGRSDQVMVRGAPRHVVSYLKEFLFEEAQARAPVRSLSGGEKARLLLARLLAKNCNLLVLDEPTNDLDVETLDVLQEALSDFDGTVLLVSHDRDFIDRTATLTVAMDGDGAAIVHAGGWSDIPANAPKPKADKAQAPKTAKAEKGKSEKSGLSFTEAHRLKELPNEIERLTAEIAKLEELLSDPDLFTREPVKFQKATDALVERQQKLSAAEDLWLELEEKANG